MSLLGSILSAGAAFIPGVGPLISAGIGVADQAISQKKAKDEANEANAQAETIARASSKQFPMVGDLSSAMFGTQESKPMLGSGNNANILGKSTYLSEKFGFNKV